MTAPTPGPWVIHDVSGTGVFNCTVRAPGISEPSRPSPGVAKILTPRSWDESRANAHLIAAAPNLLAAAKEALHDLKARQEHLDAGQWDNADDATLAGILEGAIAKAESRA